MRRNHRSSERTSISESSSSEAAARQRRGADSPSSASWFQRFGPVALLLVVVVLVFYPVLSGELLHWDDHLNITENPRFLSPLGAGLGSFWTEPYLDLYIPLTYTFWAGETSLSRRLSSGRVQFDARVFHAGNLLLHLLNCWLVFQLLSILVSNRMAALAGALLFALHPLVVEPVAWVTATKTLLGSCLALAAATVYLGGHAHSHLMSTRSAVATVLFGLSLLAMPSSVMLPMALAVVAVYWQRREVRVVGVVLASWLALALAAAAITSGLQSDKTDIPAVAWWQRPWIAADAIGFYVAKLLVPFGFTPDHGRTPTWVVNQAPWLALLAVVTVVLLVLLARRQPAVAIALLLSGLILLPVLGLIPFSHQKISTVADRYAYLALLGPALALAIALARWPGRWTYGAVLALIALWGVQSNLQARVWKDDRTLMEHALAVQPRSCMAHNNLANVLLRARKLEEARPHAQSAVQLRPNEVDARCTLGAILVELGDLDAAVTELEVARQLAPDAQLPCDNLALAHLKRGQRLVESEKLADAAAAFESALALRPNSDRALNALAIVRWKQGDGQAATKLFEQALSVAPENPQYHLNLARVTLASKDGEGALVHLRRATTLDPKLVSGFRMIGEIHSGDGDWEEAERAFQRAVTLKPDDPDLLVALATAQEQLGKYPETIRLYRRALGLNDKHVTAANNLAWLLATANDPALRDGTEAVRLATMCCQQQTDPPAGMLDTLAAAQAEAGRFEDAVQTVEKAKIKAEASDDKALVEILTQRLELYRQGLAYRQEEPDR